MNEVPVKTNTAYIMRMDRAPAFLLVQISSVQAKSGSPVLVDHCTEWPRMVLLFKVWFPSVVHYALMTNITTPVLEVFRYIIRWLYQCPLYSRSCQHAVLSQLVLLDVWSGLEQHEMRCYESRTGTVYLPNVRQTYPCSRGPPNIHCNTRR